MFFVFIFLNSTKLIRSVCQKHIFLIVVACTCANYDFHLFLLQIDFYFSAMYLVKVVLYAVY
jgi:hypothetical protein